MSHPSFILFAVPVIVSAAVAQADCPPITPSPYWKNTIDFPDEPFAVLGSGGDIPTWVKFTMLTCDPSVVYFQDSNQYAFHYDFAANELDPFLGMTREEYDLISLYEAGQQAILGAVLFPGWPPSTPPEDGFPQEFGIEFVRQDPYTPQEIVDLFHTVRMAVNADPGVQAYYFPTFEQRPTAMDSLEFLEANGVQVSSAGRWATSNPCYSAGWALGPLNFVAGEDIDAEYLAGNLEPGDILLTDAVPASIPFVAGILSLTPSTPNSHVAILANTFNVPFVHLALAEDAAEAQSLVDNRVIVRAKLDTYTDQCQYTLLNIEGVLDEQTITDLLALKEPPVLDILPMAPYGAYSAPTDDMQLSDIQYFGGKAANFGFLRRAIPDHSPVSAAFSFDLWNEFLDQTLASGPTLRDDISTRLSAYAWPPDFSAVADELAQIRELIENDALTSFSPTLEAAVIQTLQDTQYGFDPERKIRFRSSTNVEDSEHFSGAGLYDSRSGCLADELDGDDEGPSICDPDQSNERGVFRAIRRVFRSFYNDNAFLERLRHGVNEGDVGMAVLVHHSFPDEIELANGVATLHWNGWTTVIFLVTQDGAVSVTEPPPGTIPEEVRVVDDGMWPAMYEILAYSNLVQWGETVLEWQADYEELTQLLLAVSTEFRDTTLKDTYILDFEYKKLAPDGDLVVKQVREVPQPDDEPSMSPFLVNQPTEYVVLQSEFVNILAVHRLKTRLYLETRNTWLTADSLQGTPHADVVFEFPADCQVHQLSGTVTTLPDAFYSFSGDATTDGWGVADVGNPRTYRLIANGMDMLVPPSQPLVTQRDIYYGTRTLEAEYDNPVPNICWYFPCPDPTTTDFVTLVPHFDPDPDDQLIERTFVGTSGLVISTSYYWPPEPQGGVVIYTAPLVRYDETTIEGLTTVPIVLHGYYSQSYSPGHHNFTERFVFDPWLDPGLLPHQRVELDAQNIRLIYVQASANDVEDLRFYSNAELGESCPPPLVPGDFDGDGDVSLSDFPAFQDCLAGPVVAPTPTDPVTPQDCLDVFDFDYDTNVDLHDFAEFQEAFGG